MKYALRKLDDTEFKNPFDRWGPACMMDLCMPETMSICLLRQLVNLRKHFICSRKQLFRSR